MNKYQIDQAMRRVAQDPQSATYKVRADGTTAATFADYAALTVYRKPLTKDEVFAVGGLIAADRWRVWEVWTQTLEAAKAPSPKAGDVFVVNGESWIARRVDASMMQRVQHCLCQKTDASLT
jgi:hypothetical protein